MVESSSSSSSTTTITADRCHLKAFKCTKLCDSCDCKFDYPWLDKNKDMYSHFDPHCEDDNLSLEIGGVGQGKTNGWKCCDFNMRK
jgi:hypothetical protein